MLHLADGCLGGDNLRQRLYEDQPAWNQLYGIRICYPAANEPARFTHSTREDEVWKMEIKMLIGAPTCFPLCDCTDQSACLSSLIHSIATRVIKLAHAKSSVALAPALVETYSRLLVYMEIESLGIKGFISE